jgi:hypothetical protein
MDLERFSMGKRNLPDWLGLIEKYAKSIYNKL